MPDTSHRDHREGSYVHLARKGDPTGEPSGAWRYARIVGYKRIVDNKTVTREDGSTVQVRDAVYGYGSTKPTALRQRDWERHPGPAWDKALVFPVHDLRHTNATLLLGNGAYADADEHVT